MPFFGFLIGLSVGAGNTYIGVFSMKNLVKWFGIIAITAVIGFSMAGCGGDGSGGNNGGGGKTSPLLDSIADMRVWLAEQPANTKSSAYTVKLNIDNTANFTDLKTLLINAADKYVYLDLSYGFITTIPERAFSSCATLTGITLPNSIDIISEGTFRECNNLASVNFGSGVTRIWGGAFYGCNSFVSVTIPNSINVITEEAFYSCTNLTRVMFQGAGTGLIVAFHGDLDYKYGAGGAGTYTTTAPVSSDSIWTKQ
jgi:hypothetical protein